MTALTIAGNAGVVIAHQQPAGGGLVAGVATQTGGQMALGLSAAVGVVMAVGAGGLLYRRVVHACAGEVQGRMAGIAVDDDRDVIDLLTDRDGRVMTTVTRPRCTGKDAVDMTRLTGGKLMFARQRITGSEVIEIATNCLTSSRLACDDGTDRYTQYQRTEQAFQNTGSYRQGAGPLVKLTLLASA